ncbi:MAG: hypothetical protein QNL62_22310 [Gammaproteobacteria bacterium]|nr:hypothetical protein [Gammaproteobacteria bacterium]
MSFIKLSGWLVFCGLFSLCCSHWVVADTIYQWTDPWGQIKYSKTQVSGSMVSELTELPEIQEFTEQQKQQAMLQKMQAIKHADTLRREKESAEKFLRQQSKINESHCRKLRNMLTDVKLRNIRKYTPYRYYLSGDRYYRGRPFFPDRYDYYPDSSFDFLEQDLYLEIRKYCR